MSAVENVPGLTASIVVPVFHNERSIPPLCEKLDQLSLNCAKKNIALEVVFIDDGSKDNSFDTLLKMKDMHYAYATKIIRLARNFGSTVAIRTGIKHISGNCAITLSADLQDPLTLFPKCLMIGLMVISSLFVPGIAEDPVSTKIFSFFFYRFIRSFVLPDYPAGGFDLALMDKSILPFLSASSSQLFTPIQVYSMGFRPKINYYHREKRKHGKSKWTFAKKLALFVDIGLSFSRKPARVLSLAGVVVSLGSFLYGVYVIISALSTGISVPGFAAIMSAMAILSSIMIGFCLSA